ncbi:MAG: 4-(cytidine 5'-diphospho)-2-C-methyl-D-erythritol kinase, partial [Oscillospiraceae bacterium]
EENIAYKVATKFFDAAKISDRGIEISIKKNIPVGAGLGGGSADGAAVLKMLNKMFETNFSIEQLAEIGVSVGADIPFCLYGATALVEGIGEKITPINRLPNCYIVVAKPAVSVNTANAFKAFDDSKTSCKVNVLSLIDAIKNANLISISHNLFNVFEQVIDIKEIENIKKIMHQYGALNQIMTGSGSAVFGIFDDEKFACNCAKMLKTYTDFSFLCNPIYEKNV